MSTTIDNRVVEMRFNNQQFEKNANESISTLGKLKEALKFDKSSTKGLEDLNRSTKNFDLDSVTKAVDNVSSHFDAMGVVGMTVMNRITNAAIDFGKKAFSSITGGLDEGFAKYSSKMEAVQVMMINSGESLSAINELLQDLQYYTDETSYSFSQMVTAMGQFTAANVDLYDAEEMVQGIANWAATAGVGVNAAGRAFENMAQAIAKGALTLEDAKTLNAMNMFTPDFRRLILETGAALGNVRKEGDKFFANVSTGFGKIKEVEVTAENFMTTLKGKWADTDVMTEVLHLYNAASDELDEFDLSILKAAGLSETFGEKAYDAAYVAKTFADAVGAIKDAISSGWSTTYENIFGNYKEAAEVWTDLANVVATIVSNMAEVRNELFAGWKELGGREYLIMTIIEACRNLALVLSAVKAGFDTAFGGLDSRGLYDYTVSLHEFVLALRPSEETLRRISGVVALFFTALQGYIPIVKTLAGLVFQIISFVASLASGLLLLGAQQLTIIRQSGILSTVLETVTNTLKLVAFAIASVLIAIGKFIQSLRELPVIQRIVTDLRASFENFGTKAREAFENIVNAIASFLIKVNDVKNSGLSAFFEQLNTILDKVWTTLKNVKKTFVDFFEFLIGKTKSIDLANKKMLDLSSTTKKVGEGIEGISKSIDRSSIETKVSGITTTFRNLFTELKNSKAALAIAGAGIAALIAKLMIGGSSNKGSIGGMIGGPIGMLFGDGGLKKVAAFGAIGAGLVFLVKHLKKVQDASNDTAKVLEKTLGKPSLFNLGKLSGGQNSSLANLSNGIKGLKKSADELEPKISIFDRLKIAFGALVDTINAKLTPASNAIKKFFGNLSLGKIIVGAFALTVFKNLLMFGGTLGAVPFLLTQVGALLNNINSAMVNWSIWGVDSLGDTCVKIGQSLMYLAGAMWIIAQVPADRFSDVVNAVSGFMKTMLIITGISSILAIFGKLGNIWDFGLMLLSIAGAVMILAGAMKLIENVQPEVVNTIAGLVVLVGTFAIIGSAVSNFKGISIVVKDIERVSISFMGLALAIAALAISLWRLSAIKDIEKLKEASKALNTGLLSFAVVFATAAKVGFIGKTALASAGVLIAAAVAFKVLTDTLVQITDSKLGIDHLVANGGKIGEILIVLGALFLGIHGLTKFFKPLAKDAALMSISLLALTASMSLLTGLLIGLSKVSEYLTEPGLWMGGGVLLAVAISLHIAMKGFAGVGKDAAMASLALIAVTFAFTALAGLGIVLSLIPDPWMFGKALGSIIVLGGIVAILNHTASKIKPGSWKPIASMVAAIAVIAGSLIAITKYGDMSNIAPAALSLGGVLLALAFSFKIISNFREKKVNTKVLLELIGAVAVIGASLFGIARYNWKQIAAAAGGVGGTLLAFAEAFKIISNFREKKVNTKVLGTLVGALAIIGASLYGIARYNWKQIAAASGGISITLLAFAAAFKIIGSFKTKAVNLAALGELVGALAIIGASLFGIARYDWLSIGAAGAAISGTLLAFAGAFKIIGSFKTKAVNLAALGELVGALAIIGASLYGIARYNWLQIGVAAASMSGVLAVLAVVYKIIGTTNVGAVDYVSLIALVAALGVIGVSLSTIAQYPWQQILASMVAVDATMLALAGVLAIISGIGTGAGPGAVAGAVAFGILAGSMILLAGALRMLEGITFETIGQGLLMLGGAIAVLTGLSALFGFVPVLIVGLGALAIAFIAFGAGAIEFGIAANLVTAAISTFTQALVTLGSIGPEMAQNITNSLIALGQGIGAGLASIITSFVSTLTTGLLKGLLGAVAVIVSLAPQFISAGHSLISSLGDAMYKAVFEFIPGVINALKEKAKGLIGPAGTEIIESFKSTIGGMASSVIECGAKLGENLWQGLKDFLGIGTAGFIDGSHGWGGDALGPNMGDAFDTAISDILPGVAANGASLGDTLTTSLYNSVSSGLGPVWSLIQAVLGAAGEAADAASNAVDEAADEVEVKYHTAAERKKILDLARQKNSEEGSDALRESGNEISYQEHESIERRLRYAYNQRKKAEEAAEGAGGGGGGGGGGASGAAEEARELFDVWKDGGKIIQKVAERFGDTYKTLGYTHPLQMGKDAVEALANKLYDLSVVGVDAATLASVTAEDKLADMKELFDGFVSGIQDSLQNAGDAFGGFTVNASESIDEWIKKLNKQSVSIDSWVSHIEQLAKRTGDYNLVSQFIEWGPSEDDRLLKVLASPASKIKALSDSLYDYQDTNMEKLKDRTYRIAAAAASTTLKQAEDGAEDINTAVTESANETSDAVVEAAEDASKAVTNEAVKAYNETVVTSEATAKILNNDIDSVSKNAKDAVTSYVTVNKNGTAAVINSLGQVIKANGELGKSAFDAAKMTQEAMNEVELAYKTTYEGVYDAVSSGFDFFGKFNKDTELTKEDFLEDVEDNIHGWTEMYEGMGELLYKGLDKGIVEKLYKMGDGAYEYVKVMNEMSESEIDKLNSMFEQSKTLADQLAAQLSQDMATAAALASQGFINGLDQVGVYEAAKNSAKQAVGGWIDTWKNGGSVEVGTATAEGFQNGLSENQSTIDQSFLNIVNSAEVVWAAGASKSMAYVAGQAIDGFINTITSEETKARVRDAFGSCLVDPAVETTEDGFEIQSPSKVFARIGEYCVLGLSNGLYDNAGLVEAATESMGNSAIDSMQTVVGHIADIVNGEVQVDPTIRPVMDLSGVEAGAAAIDSMFGGRSYAMTRGINAQSASASTNDLMAQMMAQQGMAGAVNNASPINMYVYAAPGQSEEEIANIVEQKIMFRINRNGGVWR